MKVPEWMFGIINPIVKTLLKSPLHGLLSSSVLVVYFTGRRSGRALSTPVRYVRMDDHIRCYSNTDTQWWRNLREGQARLLVAGREQAYRTEVIEDDVPAIRSALQHYLGVYPQDAVYHDVRVNKDGTLVETDLERAARQAVVVIARPDQPASSDSGSAAAI